MSVLLRLWACVAVLGSCGMAFAGNFFGLGGCGVSFPHPRDFAGVYQYRDTDRRYVRLQIDPYGTANLHTLGDAPSAAGVILMAGRTQMEELPHDEFVFKGVSYLDGSVLTRRYKPTWKGGRQEILDVTDPSNPIKLRPATPPFPWTSAFVVSALIVGGLMGRYSARRGDKTHDSASPQ